MIDDRRESVGVADGFAAHATTPPVPPCCQVCGNEEVRLIRFTLQRKVRYGSRTTTRGGGGITLCSRCWTGLRKQSRQG